MFQLYSEGPMPDAAYRYPLAQNSQKSKPYFRYSEFPKTVLPRMKLPGKQSVQLLAYVSNTHGRGWGKRILPPLRNVPPAKQANC